MFIQDYLNTYIPVDLTDYIIGPFLTDFDKQTLWGEYDDYYCENACRINNLGLVKVAKMNGAKLNGWCCGIAAINGNLDMLKWLRSNNCQWNGSVTIYAAQKGYVDILKWAIDNGCEWSRWTVIACANNNEGITMLRYLQGIDNFRVRHCLYLCETAIENGHLHILRWAIKNGYKLSYKYISLAIKYGHLHILKWVVKKGYFNICITHINEAIEYGHTDIERWLHFITSAPRMLRFASLTERMVGVPIGPYVGPYP